MSRTTAAAPASAASSMALDTNGARPISTVPLTGTRYTAPPSCPRRNGTVAPSIAASTASRSGAPYCRWLFMA